MLPHALELLVIILLIVELSYVLLVAIPSTGVIARCQPLFVLMRWSVIRLTAMDTVPAPLESASVDRCMLVVAVNHWTVIWRTAAGKALARKVSAKLFFSIF